jgi:hypothetical protein
VNGNHVKNHPFVLSKSTRDGTISKKTLVAQNMAFQE